MRYTLPLLLTCLLALGACGQKGPLTMPTEETSAGTTDVQENELQEDEVQEDDEREDQ